VPFYLPIIHPAALLRGQHQEEPAQVAYLERVAPFLAGTFVPPDVEEPPEGSLLAPTLAALERFDQEMHTGDIDCLSIDIESAGNYIILVGITLMGGVTSRLMGEGMPTIGMSLSLPFKTRLGERYWRSKEAHDEAVEYLGKWLSDHMYAKLFHNAAFDVVELRETGFEVNGEILDTMVMQHYCYPEMRKALSYCATLYLGMPNWKMLLDEDDEKEGKG